MKQKIFHVAIRPVYSQDGIGLFFLIYHGRDAFQAFQNGATGFEWKPVDQAAVLLNPTLVIPKELLTALARALIEDGELPESLLSNERELLAMRAHLDDLRKITFNELGVPK